MNRQDIHHDALVLEFLQTSIIPDILNVKERDWITQQARRYRLEKLCVLRMLPGDELQIVLHLSHKDRIVRHAHEELVHLEVKQIYNLLFDQYWWLDMHTQM